MGLMQSREVLNSGIPDAPALIPRAQAFREPLSDGLPAPSGRRRFDDCSFDIRQVNLMQELLSRLRIEADDAQRSVRVCHVELDSELTDKGSFTSYPIYRISRPKREIFAGAQLTLVHQWAELRPERLSELSSQLELPWRYWASVVDLNPSSYPRTLELLALAVRLAYYLLQPTKHYLACPRPASYSPAIQPVVKPRRFEAFPSGHATEAFLVARLLTELNRSGDGVVPAGLETPLQRLAARIASNRIVAGVHFHLDSVAGRMVAECLGEYFIHRCLTNTATGPGWIPRQFDGQQLQGDEKELALAFNRKEAMQGADVSSAYFAANKGSQRLQPILKASNVANHSGPGLLHTLWLAAAAEWK
jgi:hypothetical protein